MKKMEYTYNYEPEMYNYILSSHILNKKRCEDKIFKALVDGYSCTEISKKVHYSCSTIKNRRKTIYNKTKKYMIEFISEEDKQKILQDSKFKVYLLTFPDGKVYVGITSRGEEKRWQNGKGYADNEPMFDAILTYGWNNIKKNILFKDLPYEEAKKKETELIIHYKSHLKEYGYNRAF